MDKASFIHLKSVRQDKESIAFLMARMGYFFLPFENLIIAPSAGWPALSPVFFLLSLLSMGWDKVINYVALKWIVLLSIFSCIGWLVSLSIETGNRFFLRDIQGAVFPLIMGYAFFQANYNLLFNKEKINALVVEKLLNTFFVGSVIALLISLFMLFSVFLLKIGPFIEIFSMLLKRNQDMQRFSFFFAEPSFVSVHILGVLVPFLWLASYLEIYQLRNKILFVLGSYVLVGLLYLESARFLLDMVFLLLLFAGFYFSKSMFTLSNTKLLFLTVFFSAILYFFVIDKTVLEAVTLGRVSVTGNLNDIINSDASLASRFFRTDAVYQGLLEQPLLLLTGVGYGNVGHLVDIGFQSAYMNFNSFFTKEVYSIYDVGSSANIFNMHARLIGEFGLIIFSTILFKLYDKRVAFLFFVMLWCYLQFDSYAFYTVWIYLLIKNTVNYCKPYSL